MLKSSIVWVAAVAAISFSALPARALTVDLLPGGPSIVGAAHTFHAVVTDAIEPVTLQWQFGDTAAPVPGTLDMVHTFTAPGHYSVSVTAKDASGVESSWSFIHLAHHPLTPKRPAASTSIIYDAARNRVFSVNQDNDTVTSIDASELTKVGELPVYKRPESLALTPAGKLWVVHQDDYAVAVVDPDRLVIERGFRLPYASQPVAVAVSPVGDAAYVTLMALGKLLKLDPATGAVVGEVAVGPSPRGIAVSHDGKDVYVSRFISPDTGGEVVKVDATAMQVVTRLVLKVDADTMDNAQKARGLPNYLFNVALSPDGRQAWVPGKKDNILRGEKRDTQKLTHDTVVRPLAASFDLLTGQEMFHKRVDLDDRSPPVHVEFSPLGNLVFLAIGGSNKIEIRDTESPAGKAFTTISEAGWFPRATVVGPNERLFVQSALSREVRVYSLSSALDFFDAATPSELAVIPAVANEKLPAEVLAGKRIFHFSEDDRMSLEKYMSCGACHFEGIDDGRVYDFSDRGEGFRNTFSLLGRGGTKQGRVNWTGTLDEIQDFEHQIRDLFSGKGFIPDEVLQSGTRNQPLGDKKAGLSPDLDALAAYVGSLAHVNPSPYRNPDGTLTADGVLGKALYTKLGCDFCHGAPTFTDSPGGRLHDVGTLGVNSGKRAGEPLFGLDTPTLLGVWESPPYLHDGSAPTVRDVLTTKNATGLHGYVTALDPRQLDQLISYVMQIDSELPVRRLPFEPAASRISIGGAPGNESSGAPGGGNPGQVMSGTGSLGEPAEHQTDLEPGVACAIAAPAPRPLRGAADVFFGALLFAGAGLRRRFGRDIANESRRASRRIDGADSDGAGEDLQ